MSSSNTGEIRLTEKQTAVLFAAYTVLDQRMKMHVSEQKILKRTIDRAQFKIKKNFTTHRVNSRSNNREIK